MLSNEREREREREGESRGWDAFVSNLCLADLILYICGKWWHGGEMGKCSQFVFGNDGSQFCVWEMGMGMCI